MFGNEKKKTTFFLSFSRELPLLVSPYFLPRPPMAASTRPPCGTNSCPLGAGRAQSPQFTPTLRAASPLDGEDRDPRGGEGGVDGGHPGGVCGVPPGYWIPREEGGHAFHGPSLPSRWPRRQSIRGQQQCGYRWGRVSGAAAVWIQVEAEYLVLLEKKHMRCTGSERGNQARSKRSKSFVRGTSEG